LFLAVVDYPEEADFQVGALNLVVADFPAGIRQLLQCPVEVEVAWGQTVYQLLGL
jgi:hypothetical protein